MFECQTNRHDVRSEKLLKHRTEFNLSHPKRQLRITLNGAAVRIIEMSTMSLRALTRTVFKLSLTTHKCSKSSTLITPMRLMYS